MKVLSVHIIIAALYTYLGYFSFNQAMSIYLANFSGTTTDAREILVTPIYSSIFYLIYYIISTVIFIKISVLTFSKELLFNILFLGMNILLFVCVCYVLSSRLKDEFASITQVLSSDSLPVVEPYLLASLTTLLIFLYIRMKWRQLK